MLKTAFALVIVCLLARADDIVLTDGTTYKNATVVQHDAVTATILCDDGGASVPISKMSPEWQKKLGYSEEAAKAQQENEADAAAARALDAKSFVVQTQILQVLPDGIMAVNTVAFDRASGGYGKPVGPPDGTIFIECKSDGLAENQPWNGTIWRNGTYQYEDTRGASRTIEKYTTSRAAAAAAVVSAPPSP